MNTQDSIIEAKLKILEMNLARLQKAIFFLENENMELKKYLIKIVSSQADMNDKLRHWPYVVVGGLGLTDRSEEPKKK
jgi:hypothetical protein